MASEAPRILLIDSYDSFTHNLASLCRRSFPNSIIHIIKNDDFSISTLLPLLPYFSAIIVGPGPGSPTNPKDVGVIKDLWHIPEDCLIPIFGVCLGLQSLAVEFGARIASLNVVKHGQVSPIEHQGIELFKGIGRAEGVRYHSLHVHLSPGGQVEELAWADDGEENGRVVMAIKHKTRPFWAVQYHPESVCTHGGGSQVLLNFWRLAKAWLYGKSRPIRTWDSLAEAALPPPWPPTLTSSPRRVLPATQKRNVTTKTFQLPHVDLPYISEALGVQHEDSPFVLLDSASHPGRFSIIGCTTPATIRITHFAGDSFASITGQKPIRVELTADDIWSWLASFMSRNRACGGSPEIPFWGGLIGYLSYALGVEKISPSLNVNRPREHPDVNLAFVERSIVMDLASGKCYIQSIIPNDEEWISHIHSKLTRTPTRQNLRPSSQEKIPAERRDTAVLLPDQATYISRIKQCQEYLFSGDSYELCLTAQTRVKVSKSAIDTGTSTSWESFKKLRQKNPAPHSAYLRLHPTTLLCSSPERFLSFSRPPGVVCQLRPIKGTVRKGPGVTRAVAEQALSGSKKEVAENLMIVDLIRHDLHGVVGDNVEVKQFCKVEEYKTVWQLVSVIEGTLPPVPLESSTTDAECEVGWNVLRESLPPGSMTGAPKKRSVEILASLEDEDRSVYSGVVGYWCVGGGGDWSVIIRSCFKFDDRFGTGKDAKEDGHERRHAEYDEWRLGAGGAITALSEPEAEWDEMLAKLQSALRAFGVDIA